MQMIRRLFPLSSGGNQGFTGLKLIIVLAVLVCCALAWWVVVSKTKDSPMVKVGAREILKELEVKEVTLVQAPDQEYAKVILKEKRGDRNLIISVGQLQGFSISRGFKGIQAPRPMTHDLFVEILNKLETKIEKVVITEFKGAVFHATIHLVSQASRKILDARPSDAIALAVRKKAPIFATESLLLEVDKWKLQESGEAVEEMEI